MKRSRTFHALVVALTSAGLVLPQAALAADLSPAGKPSAESAATESKPMLVDVALGKGGTLQGQVVTHEGQPVVKEKLSIARKGAAPQEVVTSADGRFEVAHLAGGVYTVNCQNNSGAIRVWAQDTAPPNAKPELLVVSGDDVTRANNRCEMCGTCKSCAKCQYRSSIFSKCDMGGIAVLGLVGAIVWAGIETQDHPPGS